MVTKYKDITERINSSVDDFEIYLNRVVGEQLVDILKQINKETNAYIFSGVIRNFFLKYHDVKDVDVVLEKNINLTTYFIDWDIKTNRFGGSKIDVGGVTLDIWSLKSSHAFNIQKKLDFIGVKELPLNSHFNFSSIIYDLSNRKFYCTDHFKHFLKYKEIKTLFTPNEPFAKIAIMAMHYAIQYDLKLSNKLYEQVKLLTLRKGVNFENEQQKYFGHTMHSNEEFAIKINEIGSLMSKEKRDN